MQPRALLLCRFQPSPNARLAGLPGSAGGACACLCALGTLPFPRARAELPPSAGLGGPLPQHRDPRASPAHFAKARKRPSRRQRNSCLLHSRALRLPQTLPGALPRPRRHRARTLGGKWGRAGESAPRREPPGGCPCSPPGDTPRQPRPPPSARQTVPGPRHRHPRPKPPPPPQQSDSGARRTQSGVGGGGRDGEYRGRRDPARAQRGPCAQLFTRFLLRSPRCLRR